MFRLGKKDTELWRSQFVISKPGRHGGRRFAPYAFTGARDRDVVERAAQVNVAILRTFVRLGEMLSSHEELRHKIGAMEKRYDARFQVVFETILRMLETPIPAKKTIGFQAQIGSPAKSGESRRRKRKRQKTSNL
jgi:hypothetical protein